MEPDQTGPPDDDNIPQFKPLHVTDLYPAPKKHKKYLKIAILVIIIIAAAVGLYMLIPSKKPAQQPQTTQQTPAASTTTTAKDIPDASGTKTYENVPLALKLTYPNTWNVTEGTNSFRIESPEFSYQALGKGTVTGNFRISVRMGARDVDGKYIGRGYAIEPSTKLTYSQPAPGQRPDTYLSLFGLDMPDNFAFFLIAGNYNLNKGDTLGPTYGREAETYIISGGFSAKSLTDDLATNPVSPELVKTSNAYKQALDILKSLQVQ